MITDRIEEIKAAVNEQLKKSSALQDVQDIRVKYLGKKGELTSLMKSLKDLSAEERPKVGQAVNSAREVIEGYLNTKTEELKAAVLAAKIESERIDITLPGRQPITGHEHPLHKIRREMEQAFLHMGFSIVEGPEIEDDYYNFQCLNFPDDHPARDMQDSMYITDKILLRTHTSPMQARTLQAHKPNEPVKVIVPGKVYRWDYDATHSPVFHQMEGLIVDEHIRFSDLKGMLEDFCAKYSDRRRRCVSAPASSPLRNPVRKWIFPVLCAAVKDAVYALTRVGLKFSVAVWFIRTYCA